MKQVIAVRTDLGMGDGKLAAQVAHASLNAYEEADENAANGWRRTGATKVVVSVGSEDELLELERKARSANLPHALVRDAGRTQVESGTATAVGVGPAPEEDVDAVTGDLKLL
ncbi:peptidyl-tRNA hydrolase Pth2 [Haladaptatus sp. F3-133]|uniref:Peptidyl-tRNA hydrolase n=1 Tax=Halorutilus salinus TaxID=2487751 RepID=A0A9Q4GFS5_9EURY|nr:peptidyl-tRNA hydrolase Pth2 [Halorutilus salinus]